MSYKHMQFLTIHVQIFLLLPLSIWSQLKPGCPPPISKFINYPKSVTIPKVSPIKVATLTVEENSFFGTSKCSLVRDLNENDQHVFNSLKLEEREISDQNKKFKRCTIYLLNDKIQKSSFTLQVILIVTLDEGLKSFCESNSLISSTATIKVNFCDPRKCLNKSNKKWEIVGNVVNFKNSRSVDGGPTNTFEDQLSSTLEITGRQEGGNSGSVTIGQQPDSDVNNKIILGLALIVTLIAFSLILGLIYFWCPSCCCCMGNKRRGLDSLNATKILKVMDSEGNIIEDARSVEVWKTQQNTIRTLDVLETNRSKSKKRYRRYSHLTDNDLGSGSSNFYSDYSHGDKRSSGMKVINVSESLDGIILLRGANQSNNSRITLLEELNPKRLHLEDIRKETYDKEKRLGYSRHYSAKGSRSHRYERHGSPVTVKRPRSARDYYVHPSHRRDLLGGENKSHVDASTEIAHEKPDPVSKQLRDHLVPFHDENRTPTPAVNIAEHMLEEARHRREDQ